MQIPQAQSLRHAVDLVIDQNRGVGYYPGDFVRATTSKDCEELIAACSRLVMNPGTKTALITVMQKHEGILTLEDLIAVHGLAWGLSDKVVKEAEKRRDDFELIRKWQEDLISQ